MITPPLLRMAYPKVAGHAHIAVEEAFTAIPHEVHDAIGSDHSAHPSPRVGLD
jgi:hypothetical protein